MKRTTSINLLLSATISLLLFACKKGFNDTQADTLLSEGKQRGSLTSLTTHPIYIGGNENGQAKYWVDNGGTITGVTLPDGGGVSGIVATGGHVYACGSGTNPATSIGSAVYWVDGVIHYLAYTDPFGGSSSQSTFATGIAVVGGHIYVTGRVGAFTNRAAYWVDDVQVNLGFGEPNGMFAEGTNIYIPNGDSPSYWKINVSDPANPVTTMVPLPQVQGHTNLAALAITASGGTVYVAGWYGGSTEGAVLWDDNKSTILASSTNSRAYAVAVGANGPVVAGIQGADFNNQAIGYWAHPLNHDPITFLSTGMQLGRSMGITVDPATGETFVCGTEYENPLFPSSAKAKYWTISSTGGNIPHTLNSSGEAIANCIALGQ